MQSLWRPSTNPHHHPASCLVAHSSRGASTIDPSRRRPCNRNPANGRGFLFLGLAPRSYGRCNTRNGVSRCHQSSSGEVGCVEEEEQCGGDGYLVREFGWGVRRMAEEEGEMRGVAFVQAQAFHVPSALFDDLLFQFFQAEVLSALLYRIKNSPTDRYACLVAEPVDGSNLTSSLGLVGAVDITVQRDADVLAYLDGEEEYLYVSGIAVLKDYRRMRIGSVLLKACEAMSKIWGFRCLVLRAYEDDLAALQLYTKQGYKIVSGDPKWMTTWIGRRRRVLMIKSSCEVLFE